MQNQYFKYDIDWIKWNKWKKLQKIRKYQKNSHLNWSCYYDMKDMYGKWVYVKSYMHYMICYTKIFSSLFKCM